MIVSVATPARRLARRINGKYLAPKSKHLEERVKEVREESFQKFMESYVEMPVEELKEMYNTREIEK